MKYQKISRTDVYAELDEGITLTSLPEGLNSKYAHARISNGKLNIVVSLYNSAAVSTNNFLKIGTLPLPDEVLAKLYPTTANQLDAKIISVAKYNSATPQGNANCALIKTSSGIDIYISTGEIASDLINYGIARFEFNFLLS